MELRAIRNKRGFTLVEVLVALLIMACGLLASLIGIMTAVNHNLMNEMRNEAIKIAQEQSEYARGEIFGNINNSNTTVSRQFRKSTVNYQVATNVTTPVPNMKTVQTTVTWTYKSSPINGAPVTHNVIFNTIVRQVR